MALFALNYCRLKEKEQKKERRFQEKPRRDQGRVQAHSALAHAHYT